MQNMSDVRRVESKNEAGDQAAHGAAHQMTHQTERSQTGQGKRGEQRDVLQSHKRVQIRSEDAAQDKDREKLWPGEGLVEEGSAFWKPQEPGGKEMRRVVACDHVPGVPEIVHVVFGRSDQCRMQVGDRSPKNQGSCQRKEND